MRRATGRLTLVDVGCGYGDLLRAIRRWSRKRGLAIRLVGVDLSRETIDIARAATDDADQIEYRVGDVFDYRAAEPVDFVVSSLLTHHFSDAMIVSFLRWMETTARKGWLIYDLQRHVVPYFFIGLMGKLTSLHRIVIHDGRISVARSLTRAEWRQHIASAGIAERCGRSALVPVPLCDWTRAMKQIETVIVGGGPAGAATACGLASMGREVMLVERAGAPHHKVCGEFLSIETQAQLRRLGVDPISLGAVPIDHVAVYSSARSVIGGSAVSRPVAIALSARRHAALPRAGMRRADKEKRIGADRHAGWPWLASRVR